MEVVANRAGFHMRRRTNPRPAHEPRWASTKRDCRSTLRFTLLRGCEGGTVRRAVLLSIAPGRRLATCLHPELIRGRCVRVLRQRRPRDRGEDLARARRCGLFGLVGPPHPRRSGFQEGNRSSTRRGQSRRRAVVRGLTRFGVGARRGAASARREKADTAASRQRSAAARIPPGTVIGFQRLER